jgi:hypothetical protein
MQDGNLADFHPLIQSESQVGFGYDAINCQGSFKARANGITISMKVHRD